MAIPHTLAPREAPALADFTLAVADDTTLLGVVDTYETAVIVARYNEVSTWELVLPTSTAAAHHILDATHPRLVVRAGDGQVFRSGPAIHLERTVDLDGDTLTVSGVDDLIWLRRRVAHPQPSTASPPYNYQAYDLRSGPASQVMAGFVNANLGPLAVAARRVPGLQVPTPAALGPQVKVSGRYQNLLDLIQRTARRAYLGFEIRDLVFEVFRPAGPMAVFSVDLGTLAGWVETQEAPEVNYVYVAGGGVAQNRLIREYVDAPSVSSWGRCEGFEDRRDTTDTVELDEAGAEVLAEVPPPELDLTTLDIPSQKFLQDWQLGDLATATVDGRVITDVIREVTITLEANSPPTVVPVLGGVV